VPGRQEHPTPAVPTPDAPAKLVCRVLGSTEVELDGARLELGGPAPRRLFTALIAAGGQPLSDDRLAEAVWGADDPRHAVPTLQVHVSRLRQALGKQGRELLQRASSGYALRLAPESVDTARFGQAVERGRQLLAEGQPEAAARLLTEALALWRGEPFADLSAADLVAPARAQLEELREIAIDERCSAWLAAGDATRAVSELGAAVIVTPYRERRWALLILGLYRSGRQGDALAALRRVRTLLADELGSDPSAELQELERRVLGQDPHLLLTAPARPEEPRPSPSGAADRAAPTGRSRGRRLSAFLGRDQELAAITSLLAEQRLVTLVGPAGVGKTRLVMEHLAAQPPGDGPWLARLADVSRPDILAQAAADAVGLAEMAGDPLATLVRALAVRPGLLVLDNCEHLVAGVAELALELLGSCPDLRILATSREPLGVDGETNVPIEPLPLRNPDGADGPAVALLLDRVHAVRPGWHPAEDERVAARQICTALDGLPLALELAAARARVLSLAEIAERLDDRFSLLGTVPRGSLTAHATLHAAVEWSVEQLPDIDRALLFRLWPFEGGFSLEAAEAVRPTDASMIESVSTLVARSVVIADTTMTPTRYRLLETLRAYCRDHDPDPAGTLEAHARWGRELVGGYVDELDSPRSAHVVRMLSRELPNLRAGINHDLAHFPEAALRTVGPLDRFWINGGHVDEGCRLLDAALLAAPDASALDRGRAYLARASLSALAENLDEARRGYAEAITLATSATDREHRMLYGRVMFRLALGAIIFQEAEIAKGAAEQAILVGREIGDNWVLASGLTMLGAALILRGQLEEGQATLTEGAELARDGGVLWTAGLAYLFLGWAILRRAPSDSSPSDHGDQALAALGRALRWFQQLEDVTFSLTALNTAISAFAVAGHPADAARLRAAVQRHSTRLGVPADYMGRLGAMMSGLPTRTPLDPAAQTSAEADGTRLTWAEMVTLVTDTAPV
jgi:predicted ATPase/DNA-binding SARP family transcriptional activator